MAPKERILVVDDDPDTLSLLQAILESEGYTVELASEGPAALEKARAALPDLILLDILMPGMDGLAVGDRLRFDPATRDVPIIFLTARGDSDATSLASVLDAYAYICKPFTPEELLAEVHNCLNIFGRENRDDNREHDGS